MSAARTPANMSSRATLGSLAIAVLLGGAGLAHGVGVVVLPAELQASGIATLSLHATTYRAQVDGIATVVDPQTLAALAAQLATVRASVQAAREAVMSTSAQAERLKALYRNGKYVSEQDEQVAIAAAAAAKAQQVSAIATNASARASAAATWGPALAAMAGHGPDAFAAYVGGRRALLSIALPIGATTAPAKNIDVLLPGGPILVASLIGPSPRTDAVVQGPTYYYSVAGDDLRSGQRFAAAVATGAAAGANGVVVPDSAVLWYAGEPWVYVEIASGHFVRRLISLNARDTGGWFQAKGFKAGERVVVHGGELLLSQELKPPPSAAPAGDDDD